ncbi:MAG: hypothetical protein INR66_23445 [Gordonia polyisoprenivorans]|nr:hypothetical protein [Gordonia polyisoprenivorans]
MPFRAEFTLQLTRVRQGRDRHGDITGPADELTFRAAVVPSSSTENVSSGDQVVTRQDVYPIDPDVDITATDRLRLPGETGATWQVVGDPKRYLNPYSGSKATEIAIERVSG